METRYGMPGRRKWLVIAVAGLCICPWLRVRADQPALAPAATDAELSRQPSWAIPTSDDVRKRMRRWIESQAGADPTSVAAAVSLWADGEPSGDLLDAAFDTFALLDPRCGPIRDRARRPGSLQSVDVPWLMPMDASEADDPAAFERETVRLWMGRHCVRHDRFDEGLEMLSGLAVERSIDPASLLFHRAACQFWLLDADAALDTLDRLLERGDEIPVRYERTARLLRADIAALEEESLDHISRRMRDVTRRLGLGRAGPKTRSVQGGVIASLDKLISKIEEQQNQSQGQSSGGGGNSRSGSGTPMEDSRIAGGKGPGEVQQRDLGDGDGWGNLPPHKREEALQQIGREFPAHYREAIEQYFKRLASGGEDR